MRIIPGCLLALISTLAAAQSSQELHSRYGDPDRERFMARPGISVSVQYGSDGLACFMLLESPRFLFNSEEAEQEYYAHTKHMQPPSSMESNAVTEILEELVPRSSRGRELDQSISQVGRTKLLVNDYEDVLITHTMQSAGQQQPEREQRVTVLVRRDVCSKPSR
jgi:hypothetical protein